VDSGEAVFCQQSDGGELAAPWPTDVPQYALWREETGAVIPTIVIQAEAHIHEPSEAIFGLQRTDGSTVVATASEVELLGQRRPD